MDLGLKGKVAIVGGGSMGSGLGIATRLAAEGANLVIFARRLPALTKAAESLAATYGVRVVPVTADIRDKDESGRIVQTAIDSFGKLDILVNNDGAPPLGAIDSFDDIAWQKAVEQNLFSVIRMVRSAMPHLKAVGGGSILNISAISAIQPIAKFGLSVATWAGLIGYAKTLSLEIAVHGINVNTICPGYIGTEMVKAIPQDVLDKRILPLIPVGRLGEPEEIARAVVFLASDDAGFITGSTISANGGQYMM